MLRIESADRGRVERAPHVVVLGAGLAGLVAADELCEPGLRVTVVEAAPFAGGRTASWVDRANLHCDSGLHVVAGHYQHLRSLLRRLGGDDALTWQFRHRYVRPGHADLILEHNALPPPLHLLRTALRIPLGARMRMRLARAALRLKVLSAAQIVQLDSQTYGDWRREQGLDSPFIDQLAEFGADACAFLSTEDVSAYTLLTWMRSMSASRQLSAIAPFPGPISKVLIQPLVDSLVRRGVELLFSCAAVDLEVRQRRVSAVLLRETQERSMFSAPDGAPQLARGTARRLKADWVISALPVQALARLLPAHEAAAFGLERLHALRTVPALSAVVYFDRKIRPTPGGVALASGYRVRDFVDLTEIWRSPTAAPGSIYQLLMADARLHLHSDDAAIVAAMLDDLRRAWPPVREARPVAWTVQRVGAAMFAATPGAYDLRPAPTTGLENLFLAGDWTRHDFNASMEGAVFSGRRAAREVRQRSKLNGACQTCAE